MKNDSAERVSIGVQIWTPIPRLWILLARHQTSDLIRLAYPFTESVTGHRVELDRHFLHAVCAIDALGVGGMYNMLHAPPLLF